MDSLETQLFLDTFIKAALPSVDGVRIDKVKDCLELTMYKGSYQKVVLVPLFELNQYRDPSSMAKDLALGMFLSLTGPKIEILSIEVDKEDD